MSTDTTQELLKTLPNTSVLVSRLLESNTGQVMSDGEEICIYCSNTGSTKEDPQHCKHCGRDFKPVTSYDDVTPEEASGIYIPKRYRDGKNNWELNRIKAELTRRCFGSLTKQYERFVVRIDEIYNQIKTDNLDFIRTQVVLCADRDYMDILYIWAYGCIQAAYKANLSTTNVINIADFEIKNNEKEKELLKKDILFLELTNIDLSESIFKLEYICSVRNKMDRNTYIITNIRDTRIARADMSVSYDTIHEKDPENYFCNESSLLTIIKQG